MRTRRTTVANTRVVVLSLLPDSGSSPADFDFDDYFSCLGSVKKR